MPLVRLRRIRNLIAEARRARLTIRDRMLAERREVHGTSAWGQYLDDPVSHQQYGIYGTAAAILSLVNNHTPADHAPVSEALSALPLVGSGDGYDEFDLNLTFKVIALVLATHPTEPHLNPDEPAVQRLLEMKAGTTQGWGAYSFQDGGPQDTMVRPAATACALYALARVPAWAGGTEAESMVAAFADHLKAASEGPTIDALGLIALKQYTNFHDALHLRELLDELAQRCERILRESQAHTISSVHYPVDKPTDGDTGLPVTGKGKGAYMYFLPEVTCAIALLESPADSDYFRSTLKTTDRAVRSTLAHNGYYDNSQRVGTVNNWWVDCLLAHFLAAADHQLDPFLPAPTRLIRQHPVVGRTLLFVLGMAGVIAGSLSSSTWIAAPAWVIATLAFGYFVNTFRVTATQ